MKWRGGDQSPIESESGQLQLEAYKTTEVLNRLREFSSFDKMLVHLRLQTCFVLPGLISAIQSLKKIPLELNEFKLVMYNHIYRIQFQCIL